MPPGRGVDSTHACLAQATLEEVVEADLLLHVIDGASPQAPQQRQAVLGVLRQIGVPEARLRSRVIEVVNKADLFGAAGVGDAHASGVDDAHASGSEPEEDAAEGVGAEELGSLEAVAGRDYSACGRAEQSGADDEPSSVPPAPEWLRQAHSASGGQPASVVVTSALWGLGLDELLHEIDRLVSAQSPSQESGNEDPKEKNGNMQQPLVEGCPVVMCSTILRCTSYTSA